MSERPIVRSCFVRSGAQALVLRIAVENYSNRSVAQTLFFNKIQIDVQINGNLNTCISSILKGSFFEKHCRTTLKTEEFIFSTFSSNMF